MCEFHGRMQDVGDECEDGGGEGGDGGVPEGNPVTKKRKRGVSHVCEVANNLTGIGYFASRRRTRGF